ncbi:MAG: cytidine deaminase [Pirellulaceae bacterium]
MLVRAALEVRHKAYAPYSKFLVGAALLSESGQLFAGCNVENASYGMTVCAERVAVFNAVSAGQTKFKALALATSGGFTPCGGCLQVLAEFCDDLTIYITDVKLGEQFTVTNLSDLLPRRFRL